MSIHALSGNRLNCLIASAALALVAAAPASAGTTVLGDSGWQASWNSSLNDQVDIDFIDVIDNVIFIQKSADFNQLSSDGVHDAIKITFTQIGESSVTHIVMDDEIVDNNTGRAWTGFMMKVKNGEGTSFNPNRTEDSGGGGPIGFSIDPFTTASFADGNKTLNISGGVLTSGETWFPGGGADDGQLWINVDSGDSPETFGSFNLKEKPISVIVPGPSALLNLLACGLVGVRGRRRNG